MADTRARNESPFIPRLNANVSYDLKMDNRGSTLSTNLYYGRYDSRNNQKDTETMQKNQSVDRQTEAEQKSSVKVNYLAFTTDVVKNFNDDNKLKTGVNFYFYDMDNTQRYTQTYGTKYGPVPSGINTQLYREIETALYATYERVWSDLFESSVGLRAQYRWIDGEDSRQMARVGRNNFHLLPFLSLLFMPHDNHEFSIDMSSSVYYPTLSTLTSFRSYTTSDEYTQGNPDLRVKPDFEFMFSYDFFDDYYFTVDYEYSPESWTEFVVPDNQGGIMRTTANYGRSHYLSLSFLVQKSFFNNRWTLSANLGTVYNSDSGSFANIEIDNSDWSYDLRLRSNVFLGKERDWFASITYQFASPSKSSALTRPTINTIGLSLQKTFRNGSSLSLNAHTGIPNKLTFKSNYAESAYRYVRTQRTFPSVSVGYTHFFGNRKVRSIYNRTDNNLYNRTR